MLGDQARALQDLLEVALGQPLALRDHAEAVRPRRFGGPRVFEDLLGAHHRVHRRLGLGEARLGAEPAVLGAAARLGVDQRAHVGRVAEPLHPRLPRALDERFDLGVILDLAQARRLLAGDQRRHARARYGCPADGYSLRHRGGRFSANARIPSRMSSEANDARRSSISSRSTSSAQLALRAQQGCDHALVAELGQRRVARQLARQLERRRLELVSCATRLTRPQLERRRRVDVAAEQEQLARARRADRVDEPPQAGVRVHEPQLRRRHPQLDAVRGHPQVACQRELQPAADRVARQRRQRRPRERLERVDRFGERVRHQRARRAPRTPPRGSRRCHIRPRTSRGRR